MKKIIFVLTLVVEASLCSLCAQPARSRVQNNRNGNPATSRRTTTNNNRRTTNRSANKTTDTPAFSRAELMFPTAVDVPAEVDWRRDLYRELDLTKDANAALYYPVQQQGKQLNLFTLLFKLFRDDKIPVYEYYSEREDFSAARRMKFKDFLSKFDINSETQGSTIKVDDSDIPSAQVLSYYVKESSYYDQNTATYHSRITALCPVLHEDYGFGSDLPTYVDEENEEGAEEELPAPTATKKPMFWVKYDDIATYLSSHTIMTSNVNNAATMSMADFFATNKYKGTIYMTNNMQGKLLTEKVKPSEIKKEQARIEKEMKDFEEHIWKTPVDSAELARRDSIAKLQIKKKAVVTNTRRGQTSTGNTTVQNSTKKEKAPKTSSSGPRVSARRQRH